MIKIRVMLYFNSLEDKEKTKKLIDNHSGFKNIYEDKILEYKLSSSDYSHLCMRNICSKFMPSRAERLQINKREIQEYLRHIVTKIDLLFLIKKIGIMNCVKFQFV